LKVVTKGLVCILITAILVSFPAAWAAPPADAGRTLNAGHQYNLQLQATEVSVGGDLYTPPKKDMTVTLGRTNLGNLMMVFEWEHDPGPKVPASNYAIILGFDFDNDGLWENPDINVYTPDDALGLVALGYTLDVCIPKPCFTPPCGGGCWIAFYIPNGLYVLSWGIDPNDNSGPKVVPIGGPPGPQGPGPISGKTWESLKGPGPRYPISLESIVFNPYYTDTSYVMKVGVPLALFHSPSGFGFFLTQQTTVGDETPWLSWMWPSQGSSSPDLSDLGNENGAQYLGNLDPTAEGPYNYVLADPPGPDAPVGGFATAVDKIALVVPWIALTSILAVALVLALTKAKKRKA